MQKQIVLILLTIAQSLSQTERIKMVIYLTPNVPL